MIVFDTNVVSELMRAMPDARVRAWFAGQRRSTLFTTSITKAEILYGIALLPAGRRKAALADAAERMFARVFASRMLAFDAVAATHYAEILMARRRTGKPMETLDVQIAATALAAGAAVVTRNLADFAGCGLDVIDPWTAI
jgi:predicted nucleic acid-binding protein